MQGVIQFVVNNKAVIFALLFAISECLALIPSVKANSVFQLVFGWISKEQAATPPQA